MLVMRFYCSGMYAIVRCCLTILQPVLPLLLTGVILGVMISLMAFGYYQQFQGLGIRLSNDNSLVGTNKQSHDICYFLVVWPRAWIQTYGL